MCLLLYIGSDQPLPVVPQDPAEPTFHVVDLSTKGHLTPDEERHVRERLAHPFVAYAGTHYSCGCGFNSDGEGFDLSADVIPLLDAWPEDFASSFRDEQASREGLSRYLQAQSARATISLFASWAGDEHLPPDEDVETHPFWFAQQVRPLNERTMYRIRG